MYDKFLYYILIPIMAGACVFLIIDGTKKNRAEELYYKVRTHQIIHELHEKGCEYTKFSEEFDDE